MLLPAVIARCYYLNIEVCAYDEGVAFRYTFPESSSGLFLHLTMDEVSALSEDGKEEKQVYYSSFTKHTLVKRGKQAGKEAWKLSSH